MLIKTFVQMVYRRTTFVRNKRDKEFILPFGLDLSPRHTGHLHISLYTAALQISCAAVIIVLLLVLRCSCSLITGAAF